MSPATSYIHLQRDGEQHTFQCHDHGRSVLFMLSELVNSHCSMTWKKEILHMHILHTLHIQSVPHVLRHATFCHCAINHFLYVLLVVIHVRRNCDGKHISYSLLHFLVSLCVDGELKESS